MKSGIGINASVTTSDSDNLIVVELIVVDSFVVVGVVGGGVDVDVV